MRHCSRILAGVLVVMNIGPDGVQSLCLLWESAANYFGSFLQIVKRSAHPRHICVVTTAPLAHGQKIQV